MRNDGFKKKEVLLNTIIGGFILSIIIIVIFYLESFIDLQLMSMILLFSIVGLILSFVIGTGIRDVFTDYETF